MPPGAVDVEDFHQRSQVADHLLQLILSFQRIVEFIGPLVHLPMGPVLAVY